MNALLLTMSMLLGAAGDGSAINLTRATLVVADRSASLDFYRDTLNFEVVYEGPYSGSTFHRLFNLQEDTPVYFMILKSPAPDSAMLGLLEITGGNVDARRQPDSPPRHGETILWFTTQTLDDDYRRLRDGGADIIAKPFETSGGREMVVADPDGVRMYLFQREPDPAD